MAAAHAGTDPQVRPVHAHPHAAKSEGGDLRGPQPAAARQAHDSFRAWLRTVTRNKIHDHWRRTNREPRAAGGTEAHVRMAQIAESEPEKTNDPGESAETDLVFRRALELVRAEFEDRTWRAFWLTAVEGRSPADVATDLKMTANAVYIAKSRVLSRVRAEFGELID